MPSHRRASPDEFIHHYSSLSTTTHLKLNPTPDDELAPILKATNDDIAIYRQRSHKLITSNPYPKVATNLSESFFLSDTFSDAN